MKFVKIAIVALTLVAASLPELSEAGCRRRCRRSRCCTPCCAPCNGGACPAPAPAPACAGCAK
jgi:hypothetical protein